MAIRAVLFDLGDTLWHFPVLPPREKIRNETVRRIFTLLRSWDIEPTDELRFLGRDIRLAVVKAERTAYDGDCISAHYPTLIGQIAASKGLELSPERAEQLWHAWNLGGIFLGRRLLDGAIEMLEALRDRGYTLGSVTNRSYGGPKFLEEVDELGLGQFFDEITISCDLGYMKPHRKIFEHALNALGVEPEETVMVGDSLRADVAAAQALGMTAIWLRPPNPREELDGYRPDFVVEELREIEQLPCFRPDTQSNA